MPNNIGWRGEGIAQVIEKIIEYTPEVKWILMLNERASLELANDLSHCKNIKFLQKSNKRYVPIEVDFSDINYNTNTIFSVVISIIRKIKIIKYIQYLIYLLKIKILKYYLFRFDDYDFIWIPSPIVPIPKKNYKKKIIFSFWDPFVFEYSSFNSHIKTFFYYKLSRGLNKSDIIITQSTTNKNYLSSILNQESKRISVVRLANGSLESLINNKMLEAKKHKNYIAGWPQRTFGIWLKSKKVAINLNSLLFLNKNKIINNLIDELNNKSQLFRLQNRCDNDTKIILISTQNRPYKGFSIIFKIIEKILNNTPNTYFIFTGDTSAEIKKHPHLSENIINISRVSNKQLAYLYLISDLVLHPSYVEGGLGSSPQFEACSVGTPCLVNYGRHTQEGAKYFNLDNSSYVCNFNNINDTHYKILLLLNNTKIREQNIEEISRGKISWEKVAIDFIHALNN